LVLFYTSNGVGRAAFSSQDYWRPGYIHGEFLR